MQFLWNNQGGNGNIGANNLGSMNSNNSLLGSNNMGSNLGSNFSSSNNLGAPSPSMGVSNNMMSPQAGTSPHSSKETPGNQGHTMDRTASHNMQYPANFEYNGTPSKNNMVQNSDSPSFGSAGGSAFGMGKGST